MYRDVAQWSEIRRRVLVVGQGRRAIQRVTGLHWTTLRKILDHPEPTGYHQKPPQAKPEESVTVTSLPVPPV
jgi:hypothetical protein